MKCLETNEVCTVKKCKHCRYDNCKEVLKMIETQEEREERKAIEKLQEDLPEECKKCTIINVLDSRNEKVYCPYRISDRCILNKAK